MFNFTAFKEIHPYFRLTYFILFITTFGVLTRTQVTHTMLPLYVENQLAYSPTVTGLLFTVHAIATFAIILPAGFVSDKLGRKWVAAPSALIAGATFIFVPFADNMLTLGAVLVFMGVRQRHGDGLHDDVYVRHRAGAPAWTVTGAATLVRGDGSDIGASHRWSGRKRIQPVDDLLGVRPAAHGRRAGARLLRAGGAAIQARAGCSAPCRGERSRPVGCYHAEAAFAGHSPAVREASFRALR